MMKTTKKLNECITDHCFSVILNANDTFMYACADAHQVNMLGLSVLKFAFSKYNTDGVTAFMSFERKQLPIKEHRTKEFYISLKGIKAYVKTLSVKYRKFYREELKENNA